MSQPADSDPRDEGGRTPSPASAAPACERDDAEETTTVPGAAEHAQEAAGAEALRALFGGARPGGPAGLRALDLVTATRLARLAAEVWETRTRSPVIVEVRGDAGSLDGLSFGFECAGGVVVALDQACARACLDALAVYLGGMRGSGELSSVDHGLLEAMGLAILARLNAAEPGLVGEHPLNSVLRSAGAVRKATEGRAPRLALRALADGREGRALAWLPSPTRDDALAFPPEWAAPAGRVRATLRLPPVHLREGEARTLEPGDVVLLGLPALAGAPCCELVTTHGWRLADAAISSDSATMTTVTPGALDLGDPRPIERRAGEVAIEVTVGVCDLDEHAVASLGQGPALGLRKSVDAPALLHTGAGAARPVELVRLDDELGARILEGAR